MSDEQIMAHYLVKAEVRIDRMHALFDHLQSGTYRSMRPFGDELTDALLNARYDKSNQRAFWEEEDYCTPPLAQEREAVLDEFFTDLKVEAVREGEGWKQIEDLPSLRQVMNDPFDED